MTFQELKEKANNRTIKLEDLDVEDILKFNKDGFLNPSLRNNFGLTQKEVDKIRRKKNLQDADFENFVREIIWLYDYAIDTYAMSKEVFSNYVVLSLAAGAGMARGKEEEFLKKCKRIDWLNMNPKEEIVLRKIDTEFRREYYGDRFVVLDGYLRAFAEEFNSKNLKVENHFEPVSYVPKKKHKNNAKKCEVTVISRNKTISENALKRARYLCECDMNHSTFIRKKDGLRYMEPHHLIPLEFQKYFEFSLDVEANIICLCSNCHNEIHYGEFNRPMIKKFYEMRKEELMQCGIDIDLNSLYQMYDKELEKDFVYADD